MISKKYRLNERELRKVLSKGKPFFSYVLTAYVLDSRKATGQTGIILSSKTAKGSVNRNFWRRTFYDIFGDFGENVIRDIVFTVKKGIILDHKNREQIAEFEKNIIFLQKKIRESSGVTQKNNQPFTQKTSWTKLNS